MNYDSIGITRKDLDISRIRTQIEHIDLTYILKVIDWRDVHRYNFIIFFDDDWSYKILKSRFSNSGTIYKFREILCSRCSKTFKTHISYYDSSRISEIVSCARCECTAVPIERNARLFI